jgi:hypothetical protein
VFFESLALVGGLVVTGFLGLPIAAFLARPQEWLPGREEVAPNRVPSPVMRSAFEPLDLGPDLMRWPSEVGRESTAPPLPAWPSASWDDPQFGAFHRREEAASGEEIAKARAVPQPSERQGLKRSVTERPKVEEAFFEPEPPVQAPEQIERPLEKKPQGGASTGDLPSPAELEAMVGSIGLAGTVQEIMKRTNWDFRRAAHHLAKARQGR